MLPIRSLSEINLLDSTSISDVHHYTKCEFKLDYLDKDNPTCFDFFSSDDLAHADKWPHPQFNYVMEFNGFRNEKLPDAVDIGVFGCSFTFGLGLPTDMLWHSIVSKKLGMSCVNFGLSGASIKTVIDLFLIVSKHVKIKKAIFLLPSFNRMQIAMTKPGTDTVNYLSIIPNHNSVLANSYGINGSSILKYIPDEEMFKIARDSIYTAEYIAKSRGISTNFSSWCDTTYWRLLAGMNLNNLLPDWKTPNIENIRDDLARDMLHPGPIHHDYWAKQIIDFIK